VVEHDVAIGLDVALLVDDHGAEVDDVPIDPG